MKHCCGADVPDGVSSSSSTSRPPKSSVFVQSPRLANGRLFPAAATDSDALSKSTDRCRQRRFWPISARRVERRAAAERERPSRVAAAARQLLLMSIDDDESLVHEAQSRVAREQLRLSSLADSCCTTTDDDNNHRILTPSRGLDAEFFCRPHDAGAALRLTEVVSNRTQSSAETGRMRQNPPSSTTADSSVTGRKKLRHRATTDVAADKTSTCSDVYSLPADCIRRRRGRGTAGLNDRDPLRRWLADNGLEEYWSVLATEKVDVDTVALLGDEDLRQIGIPLGPRRRLQRAVSLLSQSQRSPVPTLADSAVSDTTFL